MPSSTPLYLNIVVDIIRLVNPKKMLDIGTGFGKYGFLAREYLELWDGREKYDKKEWLRQIDGIEVFKEYITPVHDYIYNNMHIGEATELLPKLNNYDLILLSDVIEHFDRKDGEKLLNICKLKSANVLIVTPSAVSPQKDAFGNPFEEHKYQWRKSDFNEILSDCQILSGLKDLVVIWGEITKRIK